MNDEQFAIKRCGEETTLEVLVDALDGMISISARFILHVHQVGNPSKKGLESVDALRFGGG